MRKFIRQKSNGGTAPLDVNLDFGAAGAKIPKICEPNEYRFRIQSARVLESSANILIALDLVELESGGRVDGLLLWVDGPNAGVGDLTVRNQHIVAQLLTLAGRPTAGHVGTLIPKLEGLEFDARLALAVDSRSGRTHNELAEIFTATDAS